MDGAAHPPGAADDLAVLAGRLGIDRLWRAVFEDAPMAYALTALDGRHLLANRVARELFRSPGATPSDVVAITHPDEQEATDEYLAALLAGEVDSVAVDKRYVRADGTSFWGHLHLSVLRDDAGEPLALVGAIEDVTESRLARQRLEALLRFASDAVITVDEAGRLTYASPSAATLTGFAVEDELGTSVLDLVHPEDYDVVVQSFLNTASAPGPAVPLQFRILRADGTTRVVEAVATNLLDEPAVGGIVLNLRDLTDREEARTALQVRENRFKRMLENISDTVTLVDRDGEVIDTTGNVKSILGYPRDFWAARNLFELAHPDDVDRVRRMLVSLLETPGGELTGEVRVLQADGQYATIEATGANLLDDEDVRAIVITSRNITPRKQAEAELAAARDAAVRALEVRTEFVASVSHELRTPIHGILGLSELLVTADLDGESRSLARSIGRATESLRMVLDDLLDFTKIEAGRLELHVQPLSLPEAIDDLRELFTPQAAAKGVRLDVRIDDDVPVWVEADPLRLRQVLTNLIGNAVKFTAGGAVTVAVRRRADGAPANDRQLIEFSVSDTGIGMAPEVVERVFEPFSQAHATTAREFGGTGLGLTIARRLVELMGGELAVESTVGVGSRFWFGLPLRGVAAGPDPVESAPVAGAVDRRRVMVVEDNPVNQLLVSRQLERLGYDPVLMDSGTAALEQLRAEAPAVVLMDWQMPGMDGLETTRRLRRQEGDHRASRVPVIAMTASAMPGDRARCLDAGMDDFITKPVSLAALGRVLATWAGGPSAGDEVGAGGPEAGSAAGPTVVDPAAVRGLVDELDDPELVATVLGTYLRELDGRVTAIEDGLRAGDREAVSRAAHTLKSTSAAVGAVELADRCADLEAWGRRDTELAEPVEAVLTALRRSSAVTAGAVDAQRAELVDHEATPLA